MLSISIWESTSNQQRHSSTCSLQCVTHQEQRKALSKAKLKDSFEQTLQPKHLKENIATFKRHLMESGYSQNFIINTVSQGKFQERTHKPSSNKTKKWILPLLTQYHRSSKSERILTRRWYLTLQQPLLNQLFKEPPMISYRKGCSLKTCTGNKGEKTKPHIPESCSPLYPYYYINQSSLSLFCWFSCKQPLWHAPRVVT